jgi:hypothetical protein
MLNPGDSAGFSLYFHLQYQYYSTVDVQYEALLLRPSVVSIFVPLCELKTTLFVMGQVQFIVGGLRERHHLFSTGKRWNSLDYLCRMRA